MDAWGDMQMRLYSFPMALAAVDGACRSVRCER